MRWVAPVLACLLILPGAARAEDRATQRYVVVRTQASPSTEERQVALLLRVGPGFEGPARFWAVERRIAWRRMGDRGVIREWIDGRECPALAPVLGAIGRMPPARFAGPETPGHIAPFHTAVTTLIGRPAEGPPATRMTRSDYGGVAGRWWADAERDLAACWRREPVLVDGAPLDQMPDEAAAERRANPYW